MFRVGDLIPIPLSVLAAVALAVLLPVRVDPVALVAKILAIVAGAGVVLATAEAVVARLRRRSAPFPWDHLGAGVAAGVGAAGLAHALLPTIEGPIGQAARLAVISAAALSAAHGGVTLASLATRSAQQADGWRARPVQSALIRATTMIVPIVASFSVAVAMDRALPPPPTTPSLIARIVFVLVCSYMALFLSERLVRRLSPLAMLLRISLAFPDGTPSRYAVARRSRNPHALRQQLEEARRGNDLERARVAETILALATALSAHDSKTRGHAERVRVFTDMLADELKVSRADRDRLRWVALLHDIGKLTVSPKILNKAGPLDRAQWRVIERHPEEGSRIIEPLAPWLGKWAVGVDQHHERYDGGGYPQGLTGDQISLGARIISVADAYDVMTSARSYRAAMTPAAARQEVERCAGTHFDPLVVRALLNISIHRLWWRMGLASWLAQIPLLGRVPQAVAPVGELAATGVRTAAAVAGVAAATALPGALRQPPVPASGGTITIQQAAADGGSLTAPGEGDDAADARADGQHPKPDHHAGSLDRSTGGGGGGGGGGGSSASGGGGSTGGTTVAPPPGPTGGGSSSGGSSGGGSTGGGSTADEGGSSTGGGSSNGKGKPPSPPGLGGNAPPGHGGPNPAGNPSGNSGNAPGHVGSGNGSPGNSGSAPGRGKGGGAP